LAVADTASAEPPDNFEEVVETHWTAVYRLVYSLSGNPHDSEDLTQETFLRAMRRWESFKKGSNLRAWLLRIGTNAFFDIKRKQKSLKINSLPDEIVCDGKAVDHSMETQEEGELIRLAVLELTELTRLVFHLRVTEDLSFKTIADMAGITEVAARQHMHQARVKLLRRLGDPAILKKSP